MYSLRFASVFTINLFWKVNFGVEEVVFDHENHFKNDLCTKNGKLKTQFEFIGGGGGGLEGFFDKLSRHQTIWCILSPTRDLQSFEILVIVAFHA